jgi:hypothetical protein
MMRVSRFVRILCMLMLTLGQHAALAHVTEHHSAPAVHVAQGGADGPGSDAPHCEFDGLYAQMLGGACTAACEPAILGGPDIRALGTPGLLLRSEIPAHRSRGPPRLS